VNPSSVGAKPVFCDIRPDTLNLDETLVEGLITPRTKAIVPVHYAGVACEMDDIMRAAGTHGIAVVEAAILVETGSYRDFAKLIVAVCGEEQQIKRAMARDNMTREQALERLSRQMPLAEKIKYADYVIDTSGAKESTLAQTRAVHLALLALKP